MFEILRNAGCDRCLVLDDSSSGLRAVIALDCVALGPAVGGIRTRAYASEAGAFADAAKLARAMTLKCAIANLPAGGAKTVVIDHPGFDRERGFQRLGDHIEDLGGLYFAAGDLGTTESDLQIIAGRTRYVTTRMEILSRSAGRGVVNCIRACASLKGLNGLEGLRVAVQGCGAMGAGVARALADEGASVLIADVDATKAERLAREIGATTIDPVTFIEANADVLAPCAMGGIIDESAASRIRAWAVCGAANNQLASPAAGEVLAERSIMFVPDFLSSAGAVIAGVTSDLMGGVDPEPYLAALETVAREIIQQSEAQGQTTTKIAERMARSRLAQAGAQAAGG